jgi:hypothetical protein|nr:SusE domain-containing protein [uncultured Flavobacterium sp.]
MKNITKSIIALFAFITLSCSVEDVQDRPVIQGIDTPELVAPENDKSYVLLEENAETSIERFVWSAATYGGDVLINYKVLIDVKDGDFTNAVELGGTDGTTQLEVSVKTLNDAIITLGGVAGEIGSFDVKVQSNLAGNETMISATPITILVNSYTPAVANNCPNQFAVGAGIPSAGWGWGTPLTLICNDNVLISSADLINDTFRFFTTSGDWGSGRNYPWYVTEGYKISSSLENANDGDSNFKFTGTPGKYRIKIDANLKTVTLAQGETATNSNWLVGSATPGGWTWSGDSETELPLITDGVFEVPVTLTSDAAFRIFLGNNGTDDGNWDASHNYPYYVDAGYTISPELVNAADGDSNFKYTGATGLRVLKIDTVAKTITLN